MRPAGPAMLACVAIGTSLAACGGDGTGEPATTASPTRPPTTASPGAEEPASDDREKGQDDHAANGDAPAGGAQEPGPRLTAEQRAAVRAVRAYVAALDHRDGAAVCSLLAPGAIDEVDLPRPRGGCAASLSASIGFRDPRGLPVWAGARVAEVVSVEVAGDTAKVIVTTVTEFADRKELSIEDDVVYVQRPGDRWLVAKPSSTLYRAVGSADVPPSVLAPP